MFFAAARLRGGAAPRQCRLMAAKRLFATIYKSVFDPGIAKRWAASRNQREWFRGGARGASSDRHVWRLGLSCEGIQSHERAPRSFCDDYGNVLGHRRARGAAPGAATAVGANRGR